MSGDLPDRALRSALEFAVGIAAAGSRLRPPLPYPSGLKPYLRFQRLPVPALTTVRSVVEADPVYLKRLGTVATTELVDEVGMLWLTRPDGWREQAADVIAQEATEAEEAAGATALRTEERRRDAAERAAMRARLELVDVRDEVERLRVDLATAAAARDRAEAELAAARARIAELDSNARRTARADRRADERVEALETQVAALESDLAEVVVARDAVLADRAAAPPVDADRLRGLLQEALSLTGGSAPRRKRARRTPIPVPGGLYGDSEAVAEHFLRTPQAMVLVDGYNVAKLGWPDLSLEKQRDECVRSAEAIARRWATAVHVVFDGATVVGAHATARRLVRVSFSPEGVIADDVLRAEVAAIDPSRPVVVVTNDQAVVNDVRAAGANVVSSDTFLTLARR